MVNEHPEGNLLEALAGLCDVCGHGHELFRLAESRRDANIRASESGEPKPHSFNEPAEFLARLNAALKDGSRWALQAKAAIRAGAGAAWDSATQPSAGGQRRSLELALKLDDAIPRFERLLHSLSNPSTEKPGFADAERLEFLHSWFANARDELRAVIETHGLDGPDHVGPTISIGLLDRVVENAVEKVTRSIAPDNGSGAARRPTDTVVLWEGAEHSERNVRLARTRSAYLEAHGNVPSAMETLSESGNRVSRSTFYNHLRELDEIDRHWRASVLLSNQTGNLDGMQKVGTPKKSRGKLR